MEELKRGKIYEFDSQFSSNRTRLLKILYYYADPSLQPQIARLVKVLELSDCISQQPLRTTSNSTDFPSFYEEAKDLMSASDKALFDKFLDFQKNIKSFQEIMEMLKLVKEMSDSGDDCGGESFNMEDYFSSLSPEYASFAELLKGMNTV